MLLKKLISIGLLSPKGLFYFLTAIIKGGINLMVLLEFAAKIQADKTALVDQQERLTYREFKTSVDNLAKALASQQQIKKGQKVGLFCRNHNALIQAIFALSRLGADIYLLHVEMTLTQWQKLEKKQKFDVIIHDKELSPLLAQSQFEKTKILSYGSPTSIHHLTLKSPSPAVRLPRANKGKIIILTGGTTGDFKTAARKPSIFTFLNPFFALLQQLNLHRYQSVYIATPVYHGFGLASVFISVMVGAKMILIERFEGKTACRWIQKEKAEVVTLVPLMLQRMLDFDAAALASLQVVIAGGAALSPKLVQRSNDLLSPILANLYGTSEAGFCIMAKPSDWQYSTATLGKTISGVQLKILDENQKEIPLGKVGRLCIKSKWTMTNKSADWVDTGDLGYMDEQEYYFLCGRIDDRIVSGGENVYPIELEHILLQHSHIKEAAVIGIDDLEFGQRLKAFVVLQSASNLEIKTLQKWLQNHAARYQQPKEIVFVTALPYTAIGKLNKKLLH